MFTILTRPQAPTTSTKDPADNTPYTQLKDSLTNTEYRLTDIRSQLNDQQHLTDAEARTLFGSIRKSVLDIILQHRELEAWIFRCARMGKEYAETAAEEVGSGADSSRCYFHRQQVENLEMGGGTREEVVAMILQHVVVYRDAMKGVDRLQGEKRCMLVDARRE